LIGKFAGLRPLWVGSFLPNKESKALQLQGDPRFDDDDDDKKRNRLQTFTQKHKISWTAPCF